MSLARWSLLLLLVLSAVSLSLAQIVPIVSSVSVGQADEGKPLTVTVDLAQNAGITQVLFVYRQFGESEFKELEMTVQGRTAFVTLPGEAVKAPYVEYYVRAMVAGKTNPETYPIANPETNPMKIAVKEPDPKDAEVRLLSPDPGSTVAIEDLGIVVSFFYATPAVDPKSTKLFIDGTDVSSNAVLSGDLMIYSPKNFNLPLAVGPHTIRIELFDTTGKAYHTVQRNFTLSTASELAAEASKFRGRINGQLEARNENLSTSTRSYLRGDLRTDGTYSVFSFGALAHLDNQDKPDVQPQNRFNVFAQTDWLRLEYGDAYPRFPSLLASGKRVRGFTASLATNVINLDVSTGETVRAVEGTVDSIGVVPYTDNPPDYSRQLHDSTYAFFKSNTGAYRRTFLAVRPSFGSNDGTQFGLNFMKAKDDESSIKYGYLPQENLVTGADFQVAMDDQRFLWTSQAMLSLTNTDIAGGSLTAAEYDTLRAKAKDQADRDNIDQLEKLANIANKVITVNENLFPTNPVGKGLPSVAFETALTLNYLNNYVYGTFFRRGASYQSFGNDFLQTDIQGFLVSDRIRMFDNRVYLSLSYEKKNDNTADTKIGTTNFNNFSSSLTVNPRNFPALTVGYGFNDRIADFNAYSPDSSQLTKFADETTNRFFFGSSYDFQAMGYRQNFAVSMNLANKKDRTFYKADQYNLFLQATLTTEFTIPLETSLGFAISNNENHLQRFNAAGADSVLDVSNYDYTSINLLARYRLFDDALRITANVSPIFGYINRINYQAGAIYVVSQHHNVEFFLNFIQNSNQNNDMITSLIYRFNF